MKIEILKLSIIAALAVSCSLSVNDSNPLPASVAGAGLSGQGGINGSELTINGSGLNSVTAVSLKPDNFPAISLTPIIRRSASALTVGLPAALILPGMLLVSTANATETVPLTGLTSLTIDADLTVNGTAHLSRERVHKDCSTAGLCTAPCTAGNVVVGGGCQVSPPTGIAANYPSAPGEWTCQATAAANITAWAICAKLDGQ